MIDFFIGLSVGLFMSVVIGTITYYKCLLITYKKQTDALGEKLEDVDTAISAISKPDNKAVMYYSSPEYKREKAFIEAEAEKRKPKRG